MMLLPSRARQFPQGATRSLARARCQLCPTFADCLIATAHGGPATFESAPQGRGALPRGAAFGRAPRPRGAARSLAPAGCKVFSLIAYSQLRMAHPFSCPRRKSQNYYCSDSFLTMRTENSSHFFVCDRVALLPLMEGEMTNTAQPLDPANLQSQAKQLADAIIDQFSLDKIPVPLRQEVLRKLVGESWGELRPYSTLRMPEISVVAKATVGTGVVPVFRHPVTKEWHAIVVRPGTHYQGPRYAADPAEPYFMIAGGFINLSKVPEVPGLIAGQSLRAEHPAEGAVRELTEEILDSNGAPLLQPAPERLYPVDTLTLSFPSGEKRVVIGFRLELEPDEAARILAHTERVRTDPTYRRACRNHTINSETGKPEICQIDIVPLGELAKPETKLLHRDQKGCSRKLL
jgi:hypothetical protein